MATRRGGGRALNLRKIMIVDDDEDIRMISGLALRRIGGLEVVAVESGEEALACVREQRPDVILLDVMMPRLDGPATLERLRADPETAHVPVIFLTARAQKHELASYRDLGAVGVIVKPFDATSLADEVQQLLRSQAERLDGGRAERVDGGRAECVDGDAAGSFELAELRRDYARRLPGMLAELLDRLDGPRPREEVLAARDLAHRIKGTSGSLGMDELYSVLAAVEERLEAVLSGAVDDGESARRELAAAIERARARL